MWKVAIGLIVGCSSVDSISSQPARSTPTETQSMRENCHRLGDIGHTTSE
jgi:hypothetical protein